MDYPYIRAWCRLMGSFPYYVEAELERARRDHAPANAIYSDTDGKWATADQITSPQTRATIERFIDEANGAKVRA